MSVTLKYDTDPEALAWARERVQGFIDKMRRFEAQAKHADPYTPDRERQWRVFGNMLQDAFIGGSGCVIAAFDERMVTLAPIIAESIKPTVLDADPLGSGHSPRASDSESVVCAHHESFGSCPVFGCPNHVSTEGNN